MNRIFTKPLMLLFFIGLISSISEPIFAQNEKVNHNKFIYSNLIKNKIRPANYIGTNENGENIFHSYRYNYVFIPFFSFAIFKDHLKIYNKDFEYVKDISTDIPKKSIPFSGRNRNSITTHDIYNKYVINFKSGTYLFYADKNFLRSSKIDINKLTMNAPVNLFKFKSGFDNKRTSGISWKLSADSTKVLIFHKVNSNNKNELSYHFYLFNEKLELLYDKKVKIGNSENKTNLIDAMVTNKGDILLSSKIEKLLDKKKKNSNKESVLGGVFIHLINKDTDALMDLELEPSNIAFTKFCVDENQNPFIFGLKADSYVKNIEDAIFKINLSQDLEIISSLNMKNEIPELGLVENEGLGNLKNEILRDVIIDSKGDQYVILEKTSNFKINVVKRSRDFEGNYTTKSYTENVVDFGDLTIIKYKKNGALIWKKTIYKFWSEYNNFFVPRTNFNANQFLTFENGTKYKAFLVKDNLQIFFNDNSSNINNSPIEIGRSIDGISKNYRTYRVIIKENGDIQKKLIGSSTDPDYSLPNLQTGIELENEIAFASTPGRMSKKVKWCIISKE